MIDLIIVSHVDRSATAGNRQRFVLAVAAMLAIAIAHLFVVGEFTGTVAGLPTWLWLQVGIVAVLFVLAWIATAGTGREGRQP